MTPLRFAFGLCAASLALAAGCDTPSLSCGPGTVRSGDQCVAESPDHMGMMMGDRTPMPPASPRSGDEDAGGGDADAGTDDPGWSTIPPGGGAPPAPGCDEGDETCEEWEEALTALIANYDGRRCDDEVARLSEFEAISDRHAEHQAGIDMIDPTSPDGNLFDQMSDSGVRFRFAGALFSVGNRGAADVMERWAEDRGTRDVLQQCWTMAGVSFSTSETGWSYATVILAR